MKSDIAYYLLILYTFALCKPLLPLVQDNFAHIFWQADHIASVHHHHGDQHAEHEIAAATKEDSNKDSSYSKTSEPVSIHLLVQRSLSLSILFIDKKKFDLSTHNYSSFSLEKLYPPPRFC